MAAMQDRPGSRILESLQAGAGSRAEWYHLDAVLHNRADKALPKEATDGGTKADRPEKDKVWRRPCACEQRRLQAEDHLPSEEYSTPR